MRTKLPQPTTSPRQGHPANPATRECDDHDERKDGSQDAMVAMKTLEARCAATVQQKRLIGAAEGSDTPMNAEQEISLSESLRKIWRRERDSNPRYRC